MDGCRKRAALEGACWMGAVEYKVRLRAAEVGGRQVLRERGGVPVSGVWRVTCGRRGVGTPVSLPLAHARATGSAVVCSSC